MRQDEDGHSKITFALVLVRFWILIVVLTALSLAYTLSMTYIFHAKFPFALPLFHYAPFWDFTVFTERFHHFRTGQFWGSFNYPFTYPAPVALVFEFFFQFSRPVIAYETTFLLALTVGSLFLVAALVKRGTSAWTALLFVATLVGTSWPIGYLLNRANIEGIVAIVLGAGVLLVLRDRCWSGAALIGIAGAMKIFPIVLLVLLLSKRRYKEFVWGLVVAALVTVISLQIVGPSIHVASTQISQGLKFFQREWASRLVLSEVGYDHSPFTVVKLRQEPQSITSPELLLPLVRLYVAGTAVFGIAIYFLRIRKQPMLNQVLALSVCAVLLPPVSFDYTLVHLLVPMGLLCIFATESWRQGKEIAGLQECFICLAIIMTMGAFFTWHYRLAGQVRMLALVLLLALILRFPFYWKLLDEPQTAAEGFLVQHNRDSVSAT